MPSISHRYTLAALSLATFVAFFSFAWSSTAEAGRTLMPPPGKTYFGVTDTGDGQDFRAFAQTVGKHPAVIQTFHPWGNSLHTALPRWSAVRARPMLHITTKSDSGTELITPGQIARGAGDDYLLRLNRSLGRRKMMTYIRPLGEPNRCLNPYAAVDCSGNIRGGNYGYGAYKSAFRRMAIILRGGAKRGTINARLARIGLPKVQKKSKKTKLPRRLLAAPVSMIWSPLPAGSPTIAANAPKKFWPGTDWVDWVATDVYSRYSKWSHVKRFYKKWAIGKKMPMALTEWGLWGEDKPGFVKKIFRFMRTRKQMRMLVYYQDFGTSNEFRIQNFPKGRKVLKRNVMKSVFPKFAKNYPR
ncbi:MAG: hypothetical protein WBP55_11250 [Solirubrobacterales bacterium]